MDRLQVWRTTSNGEANEEGTKPNKLARVNSYVSQSAVELSKSVPFF